MPEFPPERRNSARRLEELERRIKELEERLEKNYVTLDRFNPVERLGYGLVTATGLGFVAALWKLLGGRP